MTRNLHSVYASHDAPRFAFISLRRRPHTRNFPNDSHYSHGCRGRQNTSFCGHCIPVWTFRYAPRARIRPDSENIRPPPASREGRTKERLGDNKRKGADGGRWRRAKVALLWYKLRYRVPEVREVVTKKVEGSAEAVSLDYRGQSSRNPRDVGDPGEDACGDLPVA